MALPADENGKRSSTLRLVRSLFRKRYRAWLVRFAALLESSSPSDEDFDHFFQMAEVLGSFAALLGTAKHLQESTLTWQDLRDVARILGSKDFSRFLAKQGGALPDAVDLQQAMAGADSRRHLLYTQMAQCLLIRTAPEGEARS